MCISRLVPKTCGREKVSKVSKLYKNQDYTTKIWRDPKNSYYMQHYLPRAVIKSWGPGISQATMNMAPGLLSKENKRKIEPNETPDCLILFVVFTLQLEILVTTLFTPHTFFLKQIV